MNGRSKASVFLCAALLGSIGAAYSAGPIDTPRVRPDVRDPIGHVFNDETVSLLFDYLRQSVRSTADGKPAPELPADLRKRMQEAAEALRRESVDAALDAIDEVERGVQEALRERRDQTI